jgi:hypothetical protein
VNFERHIFQEFRDEQEHSRYPFADSASLKSDTGAVTLGNDLFLDAAIYPIGSTTRLHIRQIVVSQQLVQLEISDNNRRLLATAEFDPLAGDLFTVRLVDPYGRDAGVLVSEPARLRIFTSWPIGTHTFPIGNAEFAATCCIPTPEIGVRGILTDTGELLTGDAIIIGDNGIVVREEEGEIRIDAVGDPLFLRKECGESGFVSPRFLRTINGCGPDVYGNFHLTIGDELADNTVLRINPDGQGGLRLAAMGRLAHE